MSGFPSLIGVVHLPPLGGSPGAHGEDAANALQKAGALAVRETALLERAGFEGIILENFGDAPFYKQNVPPETVASLSVIAAAVRESTRLPMGINVLRNDARAALAIAAVTGCQFIRVNVLTGVAATDQGWIEGSAAELLRQRDFLHAHVAILADVHVKHARTFSSDDIALAVEEASQRGLADGVIVTGSTTGRPVDLQLLDRASKAAHHCQTPLFVGSGSTPGNLAEFLRAADGVIVGSALRKGNRAGAPLERKKCLAFAKEFHRLRARAKKKR